MTKLFCPISGFGSLVFAKMADVPNQDFGFAQNGEPSKIFCHRNQGGYPMVTDRGTLVLTRLGTINLQKDMEMVLVRESMCPTDKNYTRASAWITKADWNKVSWAVNAHTTFKAVASGHRHDGKFQSNTSQEVPLTEGILLNIMSEFPRNSKHDPLSSGYKTRAGGITFSQGDVTWYRRETNNSWIKVDDDPRPMAN